MPSKIFDTLLIKDDKTSGCAIVLPFNPKEVFGKARAPVKVTINNFTFRTTTIAMAGCFFIGINKENRHGSGINPGDMIKVMIETDDESRVIQNPEDLAVMLKSNIKAMAAWEKLSYTHKREYIRAIEDAKKPETRQNRIKKTISTLEKK